MTMLEIATGHRPFSDQFQHLAYQNLRPNLLYFFNERAINNIQKVLSSKDSRPLFDPYLYHWSHVVTHVQFQELGYAKNVNTKMACRKLNYNLLNCQIKITAM